MKKNLCLERFNWLYVFTLSIVSIFDNVGKFKLEIKS